QYSVGVNASLWNPVFPPCVDHTSGAGNMLMVNGRSTDREIFWAQTVNVPSNTNHSFSFWIQSLAFVNPAVVAVKINGREMALTASAPATTCNWQRFSINWNSGTSTTAQIQIVNRNTLSDGNNFSIDDINFSSVRVRKDSVKITVDSPLVVTSADVSICSGTGTMLTASGSNTYVWSPATGLSRSDISNPTATPLVDTRYFVTGTSAAGCTAKDSVDVQVMAKPVITKTKDTVICLATSVQLNVSGGNSYQWTPAPGLSNLTVSNPVATPTASTTYYVEVTGANTCKNTDSIKVSIAPVPVFTISPDASACPENDISLKASGGSIYQWEPANLIDNPTISQPKSLATQTTTFSVRIISTVCQDTATLFTKHTVLPPLTVTASKSNDIDCGMPSSQLIATGAVSYSWTPAIGLNNSLINNPIATANVSTAYIVTGRDLNGCVGSDTISLKVSAVGNANFNIPNAFTPNGDGKNDCFGISKWGLVEVQEFSIYNRFGQKVFSGKKSSDCWDGRFQGKPQDPGGFVYLIKVKTFCGEVFRKGIVMLVR
ncbi:MAG: gliding motility-associated C-terminal domain-containing protein, partial [Gemmatimonadaceae bacterium]|nr:gliding motility-associated C-terminal domain-containing protein [Chitinophagaceae bacterium]